MNNDIAHPLADFRTRHSVSLRDQVMRIQDLQSTNLKSWYWLNQQRYLTPDQTFPSLTVPPRSTSLRWTPTSSSHASDRYLAVSYNWDLSRHEVKSGRTHRIRDPLTDSSVRSSVRDTVLARVVKFAEHHSYAGFWIDRDCIDQDDDNAKELAMQSMDLIYRFSHGSLALLTVPILDQSDLNLLSRLMRGGFVIKVEPHGVLKLRRFVRVWKARHLVRLLTLLLADTWWTRAWTYHEEFCASERMTLLIPHAPDIVKGVDGSLGNVPGELSVRATEFRSRVTEFCLAHQGKQGERWSESRRQCLALLRVVPEHKLLKPHAEADRPGRPLQVLSAKVAAEVLARRITKCEDILPILANCNGYTARLDTRRLVAGGLSLSAAILALFLVNGEILRNDITVTTEDRLNIMDFIGKHSVLFHDVPLRAKRLTFLKRCRFIDARLRVDGVQTRGILWSVQRFLVRLPYSNQLSTTPSPDALTPLERTLLRRLLEDFRQKYSSLATNMQQYLCDTLNPDEYPKERIEFLNTMARRLLMAVQRHETLWIGLPRVKETKACGIFVGERHANACFTAWQACDHTQSVTASRYMEKHVSLNVVVRGSYSPSAPPRLTTKRWMNGLCFFDSHEQRDVLFPWPSGFDEW